MSLTIVGVPLRARTRAFGEDSCSDRASLDGRPKVLVLPRTGPANGTRVPLSGPKHDISLAALPHADPRAMRASARCAHSYDDTASTCGCVTAGGKRYDREMPDIRYIEKNRGDRPGNLRGSVVLVRPRKANARLLRSVGEVASKAPLTTFGFR
jgi:hypothetical protein